MRFESRKYIKKRVLYAPDPAGRIQPSPRLPSWMRGKRSGEVRKGQAPERERQGRGREGDSGEGRERGEEKERGMGGREGKITPPPPPPRAKILLGDLAKPL